MRVTKTTTDGDARSLNPGQSFSDAEPGRSGDVQFHVRMTWVELGELLAGCGIVLPGQRAEFVSAGGDPACQASERYVVIHTRGSP
jgi:hypothetical protein